MPKPPAETPPKKKRKSTATLTVVDGGKAKPKAVRAGAAAPIKTGAKREVKPDPKIGVTVGARTPRCYESHKPYALGDGMFVHGGSCFNPVQNCDVYVALDGAFQVGAQHWPWTPGNEVHFPIRDRQAPVSPTLFKDLIRWLAKQVYEKRTIHVGCIGGHGRTGLVLAALRAHMTDDKDAIEHVRTHYCSRAVESEAQIKFLVEHFGVKPAKPSDHGKSFGGGSGALSDGKFKGGSSFKFGGHGSGELFDELGLKPKVPTVTTVKEPPEK